MESLVRELGFGPEPAAEARFAFALDFDSSTQWPDVAYDTAASPSRHDDAGRARALSALDDAAHAMASRVPAAMRLVNRQLQHVLLRQSDQARGGSASHRAHVGRCLLTNLHRPEHAGLVAIEALTHEAIHQLIYRIEAEDGCFCDLAETPTFRSPWSGARLPLHSLVHASFVWFGLLTLWNRLALAPRSEAEATHARARVAHCLFGFAFLRDLVDGPAFPVASVEPRVLDCIRGLADATRRGRQAAGPGTSLRLAAAAPLGTGWPAALASGMASR